MKPLLGSDLLLAPKIRRLFTQSYIIATAELEQYGSAKSREPIELHPAERDSRRDALEKKLTGFDVRGLHEPSHSLINRFATMLQKNEIRYVPWEKCTTRESEILDEHQDKTLRLNEDGTLAEGKPKHEPACDLTGEMKLDACWRRRAIAADIAGLLCFAVFDKWNNVLKEEYLRIPPPGHQKVSLSQLRAADQEIFKKVAEACHKGCGAAPGQTKTQFELAFEKEMESFAIRLMLQPLQGTSTASSSKFPGSGSADAPVVQAPEMRKLQGKIKDLENQLRGTKRKLDNQSGASSSSQWGKGKGKGKRQPNPRMPEQLRGKLSRTPGGDPICYNFNLPAGCSSAAPGQKCPNGWHLCAEPGCGLPHSLVSAHSLTKA